jgi:RNA polymerase sigma-70 factor (ECF subfamily)
MRLEIQKSRTEEDLIKGCKAKEALAQRLVFERYAGKMFALCIRYIKDRSEAEEIMIGGFTKVFEKVNQFKSEGSFEGWIRRIMVNESLIYLRKNKNMYLEVDISEADREPNFQTLETELEAEDLMKMIQELPMGYRTVFNLYAIEGYSHQEIADQLGINVNTSKSQLSRARKILQKLLLDRTRREDLKMVNYE